MSQNLQTLLNVAAELRAVGHTWEAVARRVHRKARTCQKWPSRFRVQWEPVYRAAQRRRFDEISNEAATHLQDLMRCDDLKIRVKASEVWVRCGVASLVGSRANTDEIDPELEQARQHLASEKWARDRARPSMEADRKKAGLPPFTDEEFEEAYVKDEWARLMRNAAHAGWPSSPEEEANAKAEDEAYAKAEAESQAHLQSLGVRRPSGGTVATVALLLAAVLAVDRFLPARPADGRPGGVHVAAGQNDSGASIPSRPQHALLRHPEVAVLGLEDVRDERLGPDRLADHRLLEAGPSGFVINMGDTFCANREHSGYNFLNPSPQPPMSAERDRLLDPTSDWARWGPYLADRAWGTVREDYSADGNAWAYFPFDHAASRAYRWGEDGLAGFSDSEQRLCLGLALWNGRDPGLKERLFGLANEEGNHGEDVKEEYFHLDATPTHSYLRMLYRYPRAEFPYQRLRDENHSRGRDKPEFELRDTGVFDADRFFDVEVEYAKAGPDDVLWNITARNRGPEPGELHLIPQAWFRNTWSWGDGAEKPAMNGIDETTVEAWHPEVGRFVVAADGRPTLLFCENETNSERLFQSPDVMPFPKDSFQDRIVHGKVDAVNPLRIGTKVGFWYHLTLPPGGSVTIRLRLADADAAEPSEDFDATLARRRAEADEFYAELHAQGASAEEQAVQRQAWAGLIWSRQFYSYDVETWLKGDEGQPVPPAGHQHIRNFDWVHLKASDVVAMPDKWEYPWFAAWDLALQAVAFARIDPAFAKRQVLLLTRDEYQHPNGQLPGYEWTFNDANPPLHAWAAWRVYQEDRVANGEGDRVFLERVFHKLMFDFAWWVNRKDITGRNIFQGGFLGLDNVGVFNRSEPLPAGVVLNQADGTAWVASYALSLMRIAIELSIGDPIFQELAAKFFDHFLYIARAMTDLGGSGVGMWDDADEFYYDELVEPGGKMFPLRVRSLVGLVPLLAVEVLGPETLIRAPIFRARLERTLVMRKDLAAIVSRWHDPGHGDRRLLSLLRGHRMKCLLRRMLDPNEFLSDYGIRSLSKAHQAHPFAMDAFGQRLSVAYVPGESDSGMMGGNSNWRGPVWVPMNFLLVEAIRKFHRYYGDDFRVECPTGSGNMMSLAEVATEIARRVSRLFLPGADGVRPGPGGKSGEPLLFHEYFDGDTGRGLGASHQTGWTALVAEMIRPQSG